jgi:hypothetical protein
LLDPDSEEPHQRSVRISGFRSGRPGTIPRSATLSSGLSMSQPTDTVDARDRIRRSSW